MILAWASPFKCQICNMFKVKRDINQQKLKRVEHHFVCFSGM